MRHAVVRLGLCLALGLMGAGCATPPLDQARRQFYGGQLAEADASLASIPADKNQVLYLMERGMVRHLRHDYEGSAHDWLQAAQAEDKLETHSATKTGASLVINDTVLAFCGYPYERALLRIFNARNYLARGLWDDAAVEARNTLRLLEDLDGYPDDAYSRYVAGLCFELSGDSEGAEFQYRAAAKLDPSLALDTATGRFMPGTGTVSFVSLPSVPSSPTPDLPCELVCLVDIAGTAWAPTADYAEIVCNGRTLGASRTLARVEQLKWASEQRTAVQRTAKTVTRLAIKGALAVVAEKQDSGLGPLAAMLLFALETPDARHWDTLPLRLAVARVPCPANLTTFDVVFRNGAGIPLKRVTLSGPMAHKDRVFFAFCRDMP